MKYEMLRISTYVLTVKDGKQAQRARLTYRDESGCVHELASGPDTERGRRWLEEIARAVRMQ